MFDVRQLPGRFGSEITGLDLLMPIDVAMFGQITVARHEMARRQPSS